MKKASRTTLGITIIVTLYLWMFFVTLLTWIPRLLHTLSWEIEKLGIHVIRLISNKKQLQNDYKQWLSTHHKRGRYGSKYIREFRTDPNTYIGTYRGIQCSPKFQRNFYRTKNPLACLAKMMKLPWKWFEPLALRLVEM